MCNLYRLARSTAEVARLFDAVDLAAGANLGSDVYPGTPGLVVAQGELRRMTWGFPLVMKGKQGQRLKPKPVNNARTDKLDGFFWRDSFAHRRCLIPLSAWAEAQGVKGAMTRTWLSMPASGEGEEPLFACAGIWRASDEYGDCYSMVMTDSAGSAAEQVHSRMPVLLSEQNYTLWLNGAVEEAKSLCTPWPNDLTITPTQERWARSAGAVAGSERRSTAKGAGKGSGNHPELF